MRTLNVKAVVIGLTTVAVALYVLCAAFQPLFRAWPMYDVTLWQAFFPGFSWTFAGVAIGLAWVVGYAVFAGLVYGLTHNFVVAREGRERAGRVDPEHKKLHGHT